MLENGFEPDFPLLAEQQLLQLAAHPPQVAPSGTVRDLRNMLWSSIDNDTSRDLDQIEIAERLPTGETRVLVGIADVDTFVPKNSAIDQHAAKETTTVYTGIAASNTVAIRSDSLTRGQATGSTRKTFMLLRLMASITCATQCIPA
jgi:exoribonuclease-2